MIQKLYILTLLLAFGFSECIEGDCKNGHGTMTYADGRPYYLGEWKNKNPHGQGTIIYLNGDKYVGEFKDGLYDGWGILTKPNEAPQIGIWFNDIFVEEKTFTEVINYLKAKYPESDLLKDY